MKLRRELWLPEPEAQAAILARSVEEADRDGTLLPLEERRRTARSARAGSRRGSAVERWVGKRALAVVGYLEERVPSVPALLRATRLGRGLTAPLLIVAAVAGLATNALGPSQRIQVLAIPLLGLILWNLASLLFLAIRRWLLRLVFPARSSLARPAPHLLGLLEAFVRRSLGRYLPSGGRHREGAGDRGSDERRLVQQALGDYLERWLPVVEPLAAARLRRALHASALVLVAGVVAGMYLRGLAWEYRVTWESTFLSGRQVELVLGWILAPAATILGQEWPPVPLAEIRETPGEAGPWIHLYAVTAALFVGLPRLALVVVESLRCARLRRKLRLELPDVYLRRLAAATSTEARRIDVVAYSHRPAPRAFEALKKLLIEYFGPRSDVRLATSLEYGAEIRELAAVLGEEDGSYCVLLFPLSQTPEIEVHGELLENWKERFAENSVLLVLVDGSTYRRRLGGAGDGDRGELEERRLAERRQTWDRVLRGLGLEPLHVDLGEPIPDETLTLLPSAAWPQGVLGDAA